MIHLAINRAEILKTHSLSKLPELAGTKKAMVNGLNSKKLGAR